MWAAVSPTSMTAARLARVRPQKADPRQIVEMKRPAAMPAFFVSGAPRPGTRAPARLPRQVQRVRCNVSEILLQQSNRRGGSAVIPARVVHELHEGRPILSKSI